jgi:gliding motility-associated-like protein
MKTNYVLPILFLYWCSSLCAQVQSYQKVFEPEIKTCLGTLLDPMDRVSLLLGTFQLDLEMHYMWNYDPSLDVQEAKYLVSPFPDDNFFHFLSYKNVAKLIGTDKVFFAINNSLSMQQFFFFNTTTEETWYFDSGQLFSINTAFATIAIDVTEDGVFQMFKTGPSGEIFQVFVTEEGHVLSKKYHFDDDFTLNYFVADACHNTDTKTTLVVAEKSNSIMDTPEAVSTVLLEVDTIGDVIQSKSIVGFAASQILKDDIHGGYYLCGNSPVISNSSGNTGDMVLMKLDEELNILWSDVFYADHFDYKRCIINALPNGDLVLAYSTLGAFPVILARLDSNHSIVWEKGYPLFEPEIDVASDGSLFLTSSFSFDSEGELYREITLSKTDTLGDIANCEVFPSCLKKTTASFSIAPANFQTVLLSENINDTTEGFLIDTSMLESVYNCNIPPSPDAFFDLPDTLCINSTLLLEDLPNLHAHGIEWQLEHENQDSIWQDSLNFRFEFDQSGLYKVKQSVWFLGCGNEYEDSIYILDFPDPNIQIVDGDTCQGPPLSLGVEMNQIAQSLDWGNGQFTDILEVYDEGDYTVLANNGYCETSDTISINFVIEDPSSVLQVPSDTVLCPDDLPYILIPESDFVSTFQFDDQSDSSFQINSAGLHTVQVSLDNCVFEQDFKLELLPDCLLDIHIPNIFSPNNDGINDDFKVYGSEFLLLDMKIYDRWGACLFQSSEQQEAWNGRMGSRELRDGLYVYTITLQNLRTGQSELYRGTVQLLR